MSGWSGACDRNADDKGEKYVNDPTDILGSVFVGLAAGYIGYIMIQQCTEWKARNHSAKE